MLSLLAACALAQTPPTSLAPSPPSTAPSPPAVSPAVSPAAGSPPADILSCVNQLACTEGAPVNCDVLASYFIPGSCAGSCTVDEKDAIYAALKAGVPTLNGTLTLDCAIIPACVAAVPEAVTAVVAPVVATTVATSVATTVATSVATSVGTSV